MSSNPRPPRGKGSGRPAGSKFSGSKRPKPPAGAKRSSGKKPAERGGAGKPFGERGAQGRPAGRSAGKGFGKPSGERGAPGKAGSDGKRFGSSGKPRPAGKSFGSSGKPRSAGKSFDPVGKPRPGGKSFGPAGKPRPGGKRPAPGRKDAPVPDAPGKAGRPSESVAARRYGEAAAKRSKPSGPKRPAPAGKRPPPPKRVRPPAPGAGPPAVPLGDPGEPIRLQRVLSAAGIASRRVAEDLITAGRVSIDGRIVQTLGIRVDPAVARIEVDGERIGVRDDREYLIMNKPVGVITSAADPFGRPTVLDVARSRRRVFPVGRLDSDTSGLLLLTDDGELAHRLAHPRYGVRKVYLAKVAGQVNPAALRRLEAGVHLDDGPARAVGTKLRSKASKTSQVEIVMTEGRKREVRRMLEAVGHPVIDLVRIAYGPIRLSGLGAGETRTLTPKEVGELYRLVGL